MSDKDHDADRRSLLIAGSGALALSGMASSAIAAPAAALPAPGLTHALTLRVLIDAPLDLGAFDGAHKRVIPITGGSFEGPRLKGVVLPGGADWQTIRADGTAVVEARYTLRADDGTLISIVNPGLRHGPAAVLQRIAAGEVVDPALYYFRTTPRFEVAADSPHGWLAKTIFVANAARYRDHVEVTVFAVG
jgi:hypothetical protein